MEQFLYGLYPDAKYHLLTSPCARSILCDANFHILRTRVTNNDEPDWLPTEQVVAIQRITKVNYGNGLNGVRNHTLLIPIAEYIRVTNPFKLFSKYFFKQEDEPPTHLEPITIPESK